VFLVAESSEDIIGFLIARRYPPRLEVLDIAVAAQRQGVGRFLIEALKSEAGDCDTITLEVSSNNPGGVAFYEAMGFKTVGKRPRFYPDGSDAVLMDHPIAGARD
jgi:ribosomal protein S18 acetylase RimI-like enzyme